MRVIKEERITSPFVLSKNKIKKIVEHFNDADHFLFRISCKDETIREFSDIDDLLNFENSPSKEIKTLGIHVYGSEYTRNAFIYFRNSYFDQVHLDIDDSERKVFETIEFINEQLAGMRLWYSFIGEKAFWIDWFISLIFLLPYTSKINDIILSLTKEAGGHQSLFLVTIVVIILLISIIWNSVKKRWFPMGVFTIGQGDIRHKNKEVIRTGIILAIIISAITGIFF